MKRIFPFLLLSAAVSLQAQPIVIDNFSDALAPVTINAFQPGSMLGGEADMLLSNLKTGTYEISGGKGKLSGVTTPANENRNFQVIYDGLDGTTTNVYGLTNVDLTDGGSNDRFRLDLSAVTGTFDVGVVAYSGTPPQPEYSRCEVKNVSSSGLLEFFFEDFVKISSNGADFSKVTQITLLFTVNDGDGVEIESFLAYGAPPLPIPADTSPPILTISGKKTLRIPKSSHLVKGTTTDDGEVSLVEVKAKGAASKLAKLQSTGKWTYRARRLKSGRNRLLIRALDGAGNYSPFSKVKVQGPLK